MRFPTSMVPLAIALTLCACGDSRDARVIAATLEDFGARTDTMSLHEDGITLIRPETGSWALESLRGLSLERGDDKCETSRELYDRLIARNSSAVSAARLVSASKKWRLVRPQETEKAPFILPDRTSVGEPIKTIVTISLPAYSASGDAAFVVFGFTWSIHGAVAQYVLRQSGQGWKVRCSQLRFYP